jgi:hypothetical protein
MELKEVRLRLYVVWDPLSNPDATLLLVQNPANILTMVKPNFTSRYYDIPAEAIENAEPKECCREIYTLCQ